MDELQRMPSVTDEIACYGAAAPGEALGAAQPKVIFLLGGPGGKAGPSAQVARGLRALWEIEAGFIDLEQLRLSDSPEDADAGFRFCLRAMHFASVVVWVFGTAARFMPVRMQRLVDKLFAADARFERVGAAAVVTSTSARDDWTLKRVRLISEQLGFAYLGDVSASRRPDGGQLCGQEAERSWRELGDQICRVLDLERLPRRQHPDLDRRFLSPIKTEAVAPWPGAPTRKVGRRELLVITGQLLSRNEMNRCVVDAITRWSRYSIEVVELQKVRLAPCSSCFACRMRQLLDCPNRDGFRAVARKLKRADGSILLGTCVSGLVDEPLKRFIERARGALCSPALHGKPGLVMVTGGGPLELETSLYLRDVLFRTGATPVASLITGKTDWQGLGRRLRRALASLEDAVESSHLEARLRRNVPGPQPELMDPFGDELEWAVEPVPWGQGPEGRPRHR